MLHSSKVTAIQIIFRMMDTIKDFVMKSFQLWFVPIKKESCFGWQFCQYCLSRLGHNHIWIIIRGPAVQFLNRLNSVEPKLVGLMFIHILSVRLIKKIKMKKIVISWLNLCVFLFSNISSKYMFSIYVCNKIFITLSVFEANITHVY